MESSYRIERTRNRHSRAVFLGETIVIRLARGLSKKLEKEHVEDLLKRMQRQKLLEKRRELIDPFRPLLRNVIPSVVEGDITIHLASGEQLSFFFKQESRLRTQRHEHGWTVAVPENIDQSALHKTLWRCLSKEFLPMIESQVEGINERTFNVKIEKIRLRVTSSQWGSCTPGGVIGLNTALLFVPEPLCEYVVIHELAHRKHANHSKRFWALVEEACPWYEEAKRELKRYRLPVL